MRVYFEMQQVGNIMKVCAIDAESGTEVMIQAPASAHPKTLEQAALNKLAYVLNKQKKGS